MLKERKQTGELSQDEFIKYFARLFFLSFRFSQGGEIAQASIFRYLRALHPEFVFDDKFKEALCKESEVAIKRYAVARVGLKSLTHTDITNFNVLIDEDRAELEIKKQAHVLQVSFRKTRGITRNTLVTRFAQLTIGNELGIAVSGGRRRVAPLGADLNHFVWDPWASFIQHYAFEENTTGAWEYDELFMETSAYIKNLRTKEDKLTSEEIKAKKNLEELVRIWEDKHPGQDFFAGRLNIQVHDRVSVC